MVTTPKIPKMAFLLLKFYQYIHYWYDYCMSSWPFTWIAGFRRLKEPTPDTVSSVVLIIQNLYKLQKGQSGLTLLDICKSVEQLNFYEDILSIKDEMYDLNLLQHCISVNYGDIARLILQKVDYPLCVKCNSPSHLAAYMGHTNVLIPLAEKRPYDLLKPAGICYPSLHEPTSHFRRFGFVFEAKYKCEEVKYLPIEWAIIGDHVQCAEFIIGKMIELGIHDNSLSQYLHFAACKGAEKCLKYFVRLYPDKVNEPNENGDVPLLQAVVWGRECAKILIDHGADVNMVAENGDTALHRLYRNDIDGIFAIFDTTRYLLTTGTEQLINSINLKGETALHLLVTHVSYIGGNYFHAEQRTVPRWQMQPDYQDQVIQTIELILSYNADPHIYDLLQLQPLNKLMHVTLKSSQPGNPLDCVQGSINSKYVYRNDYGSLARAIRVLTRNGAEVNTSCEIGHTPLICLLHALMNTEMPDLVQQSRDIIQACSLLLENGSNCNFFSEDNCTCASLLARLAKKMFVTETPGLYLENDVELKTNYGNFINTLLVLFLRHGLNPNFKTTKKSHHLSGGSGNSLIEFVHVTASATKCLDFEMVHKWLCTLLKWGADPDLEAYPADPIICHSQSSIFLKRQGTQAVSHYIHDVKELHAIFENGHAEQLLMLFYKTMDHKILYDCLTTACFMARFHPLGATGRDFLAVLNRLTEQPRSLKQIARVAIYKAVNRKLTSTIYQLPLPNAMKRYLLEIE